jgi:hypothetical protein
MIKMVRPDRKKAKRACREFVKKGNTLWKRPDLTAVASSSPGEGVV